MIHYWESLYSSTGIREYRGLFVAHMDCELHPSPLLSRVTPSFTVHFCQNEGATIQSIKSHWLSEMTNYSKLCVGPGNAWWNRSFISEKKQPAIYLPAATFGNKALECFCCPMPLVWSDSRMQNSQVLGKVGHHYRRIGLEINPFYMLSRMNTLIGYIVVVTNMLQLLLWQFWEYVWN